LIKAKGLLHLKLKVNTLGTWITCGANIQIVLVKSVGPCKEVLDRIMLDAPYHAPLLTHPESLQFPSWLEDLSPKDSSQPDSSPLENHQELETYIDHISKMRGECTKFPK
jgi:hypothetical protein